tara:strand:+ start:28 stop:363 length:336 start_codon:yes stop_codon:yes gene_type:complete
MPSRYRENNIAVNAHKKYKHVLAKRGVKQIEQYKTPRMFYPTAEMRARIDTVRHTWSMGDHFYKLAFEYYGNTSYWWIIAFYNQTPAEHLLFFGATIEIPLNLNDILDIIY